MYVECERCGERTERLETATHAFCARCAAIASTGARESSELLFSLRPAPPRDSAEDLASLTTPRDERVSFEALITLSSAPPRIVAPSRSPVRAAAWSLVSMGAVLLAGSAALAWWVARAPAEPLAIELVREAAPADAPTEERAERSVAPPADPVDDVEPEAEVAAPRAPEVAHAGERENALPARASTVPDAIELRRPRPPARRRVAALPVEPAPIPAPRAPAPAPSVSRLPSRAAVSASMSVLHERVARCGDGTHGMVQARVTFLGESGHAIHAEVVDATVPPSVRSCVARALRDAELPAFDQDRFTVHYPFRL